MINTAATNMNGLRGARALAEHLGSGVQIHDIHLDSQHRLPGERCGLVIPTDRARPSASGSAW